MTVRRHGHNNWKLWQSAQIETCARPAIAGFSSKLSTHEARTLGPSPARYQIPMIRIDDKYRLESARIFISGTQALVRLPLMQRARDASEGLRTAGFITGYRGSPLGNYDLQLKGQTKLLQAANIVFQPGLNEDLAATAVWGSQQVNMLPDASFDGVFAIWYGKGPGVDRSGDPIKHGNRMGTSRHGGVLLVFGDDHPGKSSTISHQSEQALAANGVPVLYPASVQEYLDYGLHGFALSRFAGLWVGFKCVNETVETTATVDGSPSRVQIQSVVTPVLPSEGVHGRFVFDPMGDEIRLTRFKLPLAQQYVRANGLDRITHDAPSRTLGIVAAGKSWTDVVAALEVLDLDTTRRSTLGIRVYKPAMIWPLEPTLLTEFARGHSELLFVEEKAALLEVQVAQSLYNLPDGERPRLVGKVDEQGAALLPSDIQLDPVDIALCIGRRLLKFGWCDEELKTRIYTLEQSVADSRRRPVPPVSRPPYFCSGCPHSTSTKVPESSIALAGIGCHTMAMGMNRSTLPPTQMGGEGVNWTGMAPFTKTRHVFQNLGDGTYAHSGLLAVRAAALSNANITYKILVNDAVAMTGGQTVEGHFSVAEITHQLRAERVQRIAVVSDDIKKYRKSTPFAPGTTLHHRDALDALQRELRTVAGVSALIYDQTCAAEKRRRRKRRPVATERRIFINDRVCEGCGDCSVASNCVSIEPLKTSYGRKREVNQSSCNLDYSCVKGFCPSFVVVEGSGLRKPTTWDVPPGILEPLPLPERAHTTRATAILITGIGGSGVVTVGAVLGMAAHIDGLRASVYDMTGLAQKGGSVLSHLRIGNEEMCASSARIGMLAADVILGCDLIVTASFEVLGAVIPKRTRILVNTHVVPTAAFQQDPDVDFKAAALLSNIELSGASPIWGIDATSAALKLLGDTIATNMFMVGFALQQGVLPVSLSAVEQAIELNGVSVAFNLQALAFGRFAAHDPEGFASLIAQRATNSGESLAQVPSSLSSVIQNHEIELAAYQNRAYARRYRQFVNQVLEVERSKTPGCQGLAEAVARYYYKLLAYKDEYEVARLHAAAGFRAKLGATFAQGYRLRYTLAPPLFSRKDGLTGVPRKIEVGGWLTWVFRGLARLKFLRGTLLDPFGHTAERRLERGLIAEYEGRIAELLLELSPANHSLAIEIASIPEFIRGYGHVKQRHIDAAQLRTRSLMAQWRGLPIASSYA